MEISKTNHYERWFRRLKDVNARARINIALKRCLQAGKVVGDVKPVGGGVMEMRFTFGPGYRLYYLTKQDKIMLLLLGGEKSSQPRDIKKAKTLAIEIIAEGKW